ncbi:MAG: carbonic anhydrase [Prochlorococcus sp.]
MVLHCMDFRLGSAIRDEMERRGWLDDADIVAIAGAGKTIVSAEPASWHEAAMTHIALSKKLHETKRLVIMNHTDCGAYGGRAAFDGDADIEAVKHRADLKAAAGVVAKEHPDLGIFLVLVHIDDEGKISFEDVPRE